MNTVTERVVIIDSDGRIKLPERALRRMTSRRLILRELDGKLELEPLPRAEEVRGKYRGLLKKRIEDIEEDQERLLERGTR